MGKVKHLSLRIDEELLDEFHKLSAFYGRSANSQLIYMIRKSVSQFKQDSGNLSDPE